MPVIINDGLGVENGEVLVPEEKLSLSAPKYDATIHRLRPPKGISSRKFRIMLGAAYQQYIFNREITVEKVSKISGFPEEEVNIVFMSPEFNRGLFLRGVTFNQEILTEKMQQALLVLTDHTDGLTLKQKLAKAGITNVQYRAFMNNATFAKAVTQAAEQMVSNSNEALLQLGRRVGEGNLQAIKLQMEISGRHNPNAENQMSQRELMVGIMDILFRNIKDTETMDRIASEMKLLAARMENGTNTRVIGN